MTELWRQVGDEDDPLHRVTIAHFLADLQDDARHELTWDELALVAVGELTDERAAQHDAALQVRGLRPSVHLNLADCRRRLGEVGPGREHLGRVEALVPVLADDAYGRMLRSALRHVRDAWDAGSTDRLPTAR